MRRSESLVRFIGGSRASQVAEWRRIRLPVRELQETRVWSRGREDPLE